MTELNISRGLSSDLFIDGQVNPNLIIEEGCWYLCTDNATLYLGVKENNEYTLKQINGVVNKPTLAPDVGTDALVKELIGAYIPEGTDEIYVVFNDGTDDTALSTIIEHYGFATVDYVNDKISTIKIPTVPTTISAFYNDAGYLTERQALEDYAKKTDLEVLATTTSVQEAITKAIDGIEFPEQTDLTGYATEEWVTTQGFAKTTDIPDTKEFLKAIPEEYVTDEELTAKGYLTEHQSLNEYAKKEDLFSGSYNDLTDVPSLEGLATEQYVDNAIANIDLPEADLDNYFTKDETTDMVAQAISEIEHPTINLSSYALKADLAAKADHVLFTRDRYVTTPFGSFLEGDTVKDLTIAEIFAKLLGLTAEFVDDPIVTEIMVKLLSLYQATDSGSLQKVAYNYVTYTPEEAQSPITATSFYQVKDGGVVVESGYEHFTEPQDMYYMVALPNTLVLDENVTVMAWDNGLDSWNLVDTSVFTNNYTEICDTLAEAGFEAPVPPTGYTLWADLSDINSGMQYRFIINKEV
jgi:hypothetical protein